MGSETGTPGVYIKEVLLTGPPIIGVGTNTAGFVGKAPKAGAHKNDPTSITSEDQFKAEFVGDTATTSTNLSRAVIGFFRNGGVQCFVVNVDSELKADLVRGIGLLEAIDEIAILATPGSVDQDVYRAMIDQAERTKDRFVILDAPDQVANPDDLTRRVNEARPGLRPTDSQYAAFYYPWIKVTPNLPNDPDPAFVPPSGHIAGVYARIDNERGVHKAPANTTIRGAGGLRASLSDAAQEPLNVAGVNVLRNFREGVVIWGARTLMDGQFRYISTRRLVNYISESIQESLKWAVFEPNNPSLRKLIGRSIKGFLDGVWRDGALFGNAPEESYYVVFRDSDNTDDDRQKGILRVEIGLRVAYPAEFIIVKIGLILQNPAAS